MKITACLAFTALSIALTGASASAATFNYDVTNINVKNEAVGSIKAISTSFNDDTELFTWSSTLSQNTTGRLADGAWLVVNDGPKPSASAKESVIFYLDQAASQVTAYDYDGKKKASSWKKGTLLGSQALEVKDTADDRTFSFSWDMSSINGMTDTFGDDWKGTTFGEEIGIWFHSVDEINASYDVAGNLSNFNFSNDRTERTTFDIAGTDTIVSPDETQDVPEPGTAIALLGITAATASFTKRRNQLAA